MQIHNENDQITRVTVTNICTIRRAKIHPVTVHNEDKWVYKKPPANTTRRWCAIPPATTHINLLWALINGDHVEKTCKNPTRTCRNPYIMKQQEVSRHLRTVLFCRKLSTLLLISGFGNQGCCACVVCSYFMSFCICIQWCEWCTYFQFPQSLINLK